MGDRMDDMRQDTPQEDIKKFKEVFLYILSKIGAQPNVGKTVLVKILYFIDFDYYEEKETQLMGMRYIKKQYGPYPILFDKIVGDMKREGEISSVMSNYGTNHQQKYLPIRGADLNCLSGDELEYIQKVINKYSSMTANQLTDYSHKDIPWLAAKNNEELKYEGVFYRTPDTSVRSYVEIFD
ncbi:MAG: SocA family protein [Holosporaceae bacterium]|jgi:uncharacterized phage-associated protein|nr:SocA family protein [Holosporaceae bacterium]